MSAHGSTVARKLLGLKDEGFDSSLLGFDAEELQRLMSGGMAEGLTDPDDIPDPPDVPVTQPGDLWLLGDHRLLCGDSTSAPDVQRLLGEAKPFQMVTDPPYGVAYDPKGRHDVKTALSFLPAIYEWLGPRLEPYRVK